MKADIAIIPGDGIGPEIIEEAIKVLKVIEKKYDHNFSLSYVDMGGISIDKNGVPITEEGLKKCKESQAILLGAVGGAKWDNIPSELRPEKGLLKLRSFLEVYCNLRPAKIYDALKEASPLKDKIISGGIDIVIVRELTGGIYFGERERKTIDGIREASDVEKYRDFEIERIAKYAFKIAANRKGKVTSIDKANVLESSKLWREVVIEVSKKYPQVELEHMYVDNGAMQLVRNPRSFDVIVTNNIFGDILSDELSQITGSIGMLASASLSDKGPHLYEPIHGSAPDIAGKDLANPSGAILSLAMMLRHSFGLEEEAKVIEDAVEKTLNKGYRTKDIAIDEEFMTCSEFGNEIRKNIF